MRLRSNSRGRKGEGMEKKKKKIRASGHRGVSSSLPHELVVEVLKRLPAKSLLRFKCVSKLWYSTISNPCFSKARSRTGLLIINRYRLKSLRFSYATLPCRGVSVLLDRPKFGPDIIKDSSVGFTEVINGFLCLYISEIPNRAWLWNITTRETMNLPVSLSLPEDSICEYYLGSDSTTKEYKLLKIYCRQLSKYDFTTSECEILTLGSKDKSWRSIDAPPFKLWGQTPRPQIQSRGVDGHLFWYRYSMLHNGGQDLFAFDLKKESFRMIPMPPVLNYHPMGKAIRYRGHLAIAIQIPGRQVILHELEEDCVGQSWSWTQHALDIPFKVGGYHTSIGSLLTNDRLMLCRYDSSFSSMPVYSYNHAKGKFEKFVIDKYSPSVSLEGMYMHCYEESIAQLKDLVSSE